LISASKNPIERKIRKNQKGSLKMKKVKIVKSSLGYTLKKPLILEIPEPRNQAEHNLQRYVIQTFVGQYPHLAQFTFENYSMMELAKHLLIHRTGSRATLCNYVYSVHSFCRWLNTSPDKLLAECKDQDEAPISKGIARSRRRLADFATDLQAKNHLAPVTVHHMMSHIQSWFRINGVDLKLLYRISKWPLYEERAPSLEELQKILDVADLREKVIVTMLATGGFRKGTLTKLQYRHVKRDLERHVFPIHVHVEAEITKSKHHEYDTFLCQEASEYLEAYLEARRKGWERRLPEQITNQSPLISTVNNKPKPLTPSYISDLIRWLYFKAGLIDNSSEIRRHKLRTHSLRKFFRTQLAFLGVDRDYIEYMLGHKISSYFDIKMRGIEYLRGIYLSSGISIRLQSEENKIEALKQIIRSWGLNPEKILTREALGQSQTNVIEPNRLKNR
jgi:site-specific recombinase XerD